MLRWERTWRAFIISKGLSHNCQDLLIVLDKCKMLKNCPFWKDSSLHLGTKQHEEHGWGPGSLQWKLRVYRVGSSCGNQKIIFSSLFVTICWHWVRYSTLLPCWVLSVLPFPASSGSIWDIFPPLQKWRERLGRKKRGGEGEKEKTKNKLPQPERQAQSFRRQKVKQEKDPSKKGLIAASVGSLGYPRLSSDSEDFDQES